MQEITLDVKGKLCPIPVLRAKKEMAKMETGDVLVVIATDMGTRKDIPQYCEASGNTLESMEELGSSLVFRIIKS